MDYKSTRAMRHSAIKKWGTGGLLVFLACVFFWMYLFLYRNPSVLRLASVAQNGATLPAYLVLNQPDEAVNYWFIRALALGSRTGIPVPLQALVPQRVHPRSTTIVDNMLVPIGFPGIIMLYGSVLAALLRVAPLAWFNVLAVGVTPLVGALAPLVWYALVRMLFERRLAFMSALLLWIQPAWWYYASRPFQHHTLFIAFVLGAFAVCAYACTRTASRARAFVWWLADGLLFGLALYVRPVEVVWVCGAAAALLWHYRARWTWKNMASCAAGLLIAVCIFFATNTLYYGTPLGSGYVQPTATGQAGTLVENAASLGGGGIFSVLTLPFGFHPSHIWYNFKAYAYHLPGLWFWFFAVSILFMAYEWYGKKIDARIVWYMALAGAVGAYVFTYYGSWLFFDNIIHTPSIGSSYVRYFLPLAVMSTLPIAYMLTRVARVHYVFRAGVVCACVLLAVGSYAVVNAPLEGLSSIKETVQGYYEVRDMMRASLPAHTVVVTRYADKYLFPHFQVIVAWESDTEWSAIATLVTHKIPVYWFELPLDAASSAQVEEFLSAHHVRMSPSMLTWDGLELRQIVSE